MLTHFLQPEKLVVDMQSKLSVSNIIQEIFMFQS